MINSFLNRKDFFRQKLILEQDLKMKYYLMKHLEYFLPPPCPLVCGSKLLRNKFTEELKQ